jgi:hypothetical protein
MVMTDQPKGYGHREYNAPDDRCNQDGIVKLENRLPNWLETLDPDPTQHHFVEVVQQAAPGHGNQIVNLVAVCTCGWQSGERHVYLGANTTWAEERTRHQLKNAGIAHTRSLSTPLS